VNGSGGTPEFREVETPGAAQEWNVSIDASGKDCYKITSNADGRYVNEYAVFGTNQYYSDWNTYLVTVRGEEASVQLTQSAVKNGLKYWMPSGNILEAKGVARSESYCLVFVRKDSDSSVAQVEPEREVTVAGKTLQASGDVKSLMLYAVDGKCVVAVEGNTMSLEGVAAGVYVVELQKAEGKAVAKIIVE
jgi:hypothetical protein